MFIPLSDVTIIHTNIRVTPDRDLRVVRFGSNITMLDFMQAEETAIQTVTGIVPPHIKHDLQQHLSNFFRSVFDRFVEQEKHYYQLQTLQKSMKQWQLEYSDKVGELNGVLERERKLELQILYMQKQLKLRNTELTTHRENYYKSLLLIREIIVHHGLHPDLLVDDYVDPGSIASSKAMRAQFAAQFHRLNAHFLAQAKKWEYNLLECINKHDEKVERLSNLVNTLYTAVSRQRYKSKRDIAVLQAQVSDEKG